MAEVEEFAPRVVIIQPPSLQYIPTLGRTAFQRVELVVDRSLVDTHRNREMLWHRYTWDDSISGNFDGILYEVPYGLTHVSG